MRWAVGTKNAAKLDCVRTVAVQVFPDEEHEVVPVPVESGVGAQPWSAEETRQGALIRARRALEQAPDAETFHFGVGLEGGVEQLGDEFFECGWICVVEGPARSGTAAPRIGYGSSARFELSHKIVSMLRDRKLELAEVMDELSGQTDVRQREGAMGILTGGHLGRAAAYAHGMIFALAPFLSERSVYWE